MERLDKIIAHAFGISRKQAKQCIKSGAVTVGGIPVTDCERKAQPQEVCYMGKSAAYEAHVYLMLNKPQGVISASEGKGEKTVVDLVPPALYRKGLFPAGRLDKDTVGFVLLTDDGAFAHEILSPKKHVEKTYFVKTDKPIPADLPAIFAQGVVLYDGTQCMSARLEAVEGNSCIVKIKEGKYHQIKRMFKKHGITVLELKRTKMGVLELDKNLGYGECRYLTDSEVVKICQK